MKKKRICLNWICLSRNKISKSLINLTWFCFCFVWPSQVLSNLCLDEFNLSCRFWCQIWDMQKWFIEKVSQLWTYGFKAIFHMIKNWLQFHFFIFVIFAQFSHFLSNWSQNTQIQAFCDCMYNFLLKLTKNRKIQYEIAPNL